MRGRLRSRSGFTLVEVVVSIGIGAIILAGTMMAIQSYKSMEMETSLRLNGRLILTQVTADLMASPHRYPRLTMSGEEAGYVLCFDQRMAPVAFSGPKMIGHKKMSELEPAASDEYTRPRFCDSKFEVRMVPVAGEIMLRIKVYTRNPDQTTISFRATN